MAIKANNKMEAKIPIKNIMNYKLSVEFEVFNPYRVNKKENDSEDIKKQQNFLILACP